MAPAPGPAAPDSDQRGSCRTSGWAQRLTEVPEEFPRQDFVGANGTRSSPESKRPCSDSHTDAVSCQLLRRPPGLGSGCDEGTQSSRFIPHHSLCPSPLRLTEPEEEKAETQKGQGVSWGVGGTSHADWGGGALSWLGWVSRPPPPNLRSVSHMRGCGGVLLH